MLGKHKLVGLSAVFGLLLLGFVVTFPHSAAAATGINPELSFEGKIVTSASGTNIPDGTYNMEFQIYTGCTNNTGSGCTSVWTENYLDTGLNVGGVTFTSGTFQINLGSITPFGTSVPWNTNPLYLSFEIGNNQACTISTGFHANCTGDGVMSPYILLTSSPYALNAGQLGGLVAPTTTPTASQCLQTASSVPYTQLILGSCSGGTPTLQQAYAAGAGGSTPDILLTSAIGTLDVQDASTTIGTTLFEVTASVGSGIGATLFTVGNTGNTTVETSTNSATALQVENNNGVAILSVNTLNPSVQVTGALTDSTETVADSALIQGAGAGTSLFAVDNNLGVPILTAGTNNLLVNGDFEGTAGTTGWSAATAGGGVALNTNPTYVYSGADSLAVTTTTTAHTGAQVTTFNGPMAIGTYTLSFYAKAASGFATLEASFNALGTNNCLSSASVTTSFTYFSCTYTTTGTTTALSIGSSGTTALTFYIDTVEVQLSPNLLSNPGFENSTTGWSASGTGAGITWNQNRQYVYYGQASLKVTTGSTASVGTTYSSSNYIASQPSGGGAYTLSFYAMATSAITLSASLGSGTCSLSPTGAVTTGFTLFTCTATTTSVPVITIDSVTINATFYIDSVQLINGSSLLPYNIGQIQLRGIINNPVTFQGTSNSTTAFQIQNSSSVSLLTVDSVDTEVILGPAGTTPVELVLGNKSNNASDPTGTPCSPVGAIYYNSFSYEFRACRYIAGTGTGQTKQNTWENLIAGVDEQIFTSNGTWTAPTGITTVMVVVCGGGGSGGGGLTGATSTVRGGGSGGGGGARATSIMDATAAGGTQSVTVGAQVSGGAIGTHGTAGNASSFGTLVIANGGGYGNAGQLTTGPSGGGGGGWGQVGGNGSLTTVTGGDNATANVQGNGGSGGGSTTATTGKPAEFGGGAGGGVTITGGAGLAGGDSIWGGAGGGGGGSANASNTTAAGAAGGTTGAYATGGGGSAGSGAIGGPGANGTSAVCGSGGGGGGGSGGGTAFVGGAGGSAGGGGGGGGGGITGAAGGAGGAGEVWVFSW